MPDDIEAVGRVWLTTSIVAHDFVPEEFWRADLEAMTTQILPHPDTKGYVHEEAGTIDGFISLGGDEVGCLFVMPDKQGLGIGSALLDHVKQRHEKLSLHVYRKNRLARQFYESRGFRVAGQSVCEFTSCDEYCMKWDASPNQSQQGPA